MTSGPPQPPADPRPYRSQSLLAFVEAMAAKTSTPGGGSASAYAAALGASLQAMVIQFSLKRASPAQAVKLHAWLEELTGLRQRLLALVDEDSVAYERLKRALKSQQGVGEAVLEASGVPLEVAQRAMRVVEVGRGLLVIGNPNLVSDVGVGVALAFSAVQGACMNVAINLSSLEDRRTVSRMRRQIKGLIHRSRLTTIPLLQRIHRRMEA